LRKLIQLIISVFFIGDVSAIWPLYKQFLSIFLIVNLIVVFSLYLLVDEENMNIVVINLIQLVFDGIAVLSYVFILSKFAYDEAEAEHGLIINHL